MTEFYSKRLARIGNAINERKKQKKATLLVSRFQLQGLGILDVNDANLLGISLEQYRKVKSDPRIVGLVNDMIEVHLDKDYPDDEAKHDARNLNISVEKAKEVRAEGILNRTEQITKRVKQVLNPPKSKSKSKPKPLPRDANLRTWVEPNEPSTEDIRAAVQKLSTAQIKLVNESDARAYLNEVLQRRYHPGKINEIKVTIKPGGRQFVVTIQYFNGPQLTTKNPDVHQVWTF